METIVGVFAAHDAALGAGERAREVTGPGSSVRVYLPDDPHDSVVEADVVNDWSSLLRVTLGSIAIGLLGAGIIAATARWSYAGLWLAWSVFAGVMMGAWLTGQRLRARRRMSTILERETAAGQALVTAIVRTHGEVEKVARVFEGGGGHVVHA